MNIKNSYIILFIIGLLLLSLLGWNDVLSLRAEEPRRAIVSLEMTLNHSYIVPKINDYSYYNKPPVFNWWMLLFYKVFGSYEEWVVRFPSILALLITGIFTYFTTKKFTSSKVALYSSLFFLTSADILFYGSVNAGEIDLFFTWITVLQATCIFYFHFLNKYGWMFFTSYLLVAIGTLTKGPPSIAFQALTLVPYLIIIGNWRLLFNWKHFLYGFMSLCIIGGYFYYYNYYDDGLGFVIRLFKEASQRTGLEHNILDTFIGVIEFPLFLLKLLAPWSILVVFFWKSDFINTIKSNPLLKFCAIFIIFNIPLYWFSADHKARYIYMFLPFFSIMLSYFYVENKKNIQWKKWIENLFLGITILSSIIFFSFILAPFLDDQLPDVSIHFCVLFILSTLLTLLYIKGKNDKILLFTSIVLLTRIGFNIAALPLIEDKSREKIYEGNINQIIKITQGEQIRWHSQPHIFKSDASIGPLMLDEVTLTSAPLIAYQIPYLISKKTGHIMKYDEFMQTGHYYLVPSGHLPDSSIVLYKMYDYWINHELSLIKKN